MELVTGSDLFVTASLAFLLSFLVAKLVSFAMSSETKNAHEPITLQPGERLTVQTAQSETKVVDILSPIQVGEITVELEPNVVECPLISELSNVDVLNEETVEFVGSANLNDSAEQRNTECIEEISMDRSTEVGVSAQPVVESLDYEDNDDDEYDDWEGIERSELEKVFMAATEFVVGNGCGSEGDRLASIGSDVQMELYGLHKVATEGPCRDPQPMPLKLSARAKWNAWQKLGNMSPEVAMEQYITLVSDKVPGWMKDNSAVSLCCEGILSFNISSDTSNGEFEANLLQGKSEQEPTGSEVFEADAPYLSTSLSHQQIIVTERELDLSCVQDRSPLTESHLENNVKK